MVLHFSPNHVCSYHVFVPDVLCSLQSPPLQEVKECRSIRFNG